MLNPSLKVRAYAGTMMLTSNASHAQTSCLDDLLASVTAATDVSACNLLSLTDGRVLAVKTEHGLFVQTKAGLNATHYFIDAKRMKIEASHFKRSNSFPPMDRALPPPPSIRLTWS
jgi:S-adenosylhomocysteine hydrolase